MYVCMYMKSNISVSVDSSLLAEVRGVGLKISPLVEEAMRKALKKAENPAESELRAFKKLRGLKTEAYQVSLRESDKFKAAVREAHFLDLSTKTTEEKIGFWEWIINKTKEKPPEPPKEKEAMK